MINKTMALEDILKGYEKYSVIGGIMQNAEKDGTNPSNRQSYAEFLSKYKGLSDAHAAHMIQNLADKADTTRELIRNETGIASKELTEVVSKEYKAIIEDLPEKYLVQIAAQLPDKEKKYFKRKDILESQNPDAIREELAGLYKFKSWELYLSRLSPEQLSSHLLEQIAYEQENFRRKVLCNEETKKDEKTGKEKKEYKFNPAKARAYILKTIEGIEEKKRDATYLSLADSYSRYIADKKKSSK